MAAKTSLRKTLEQKYDAQRRPKVQRDPAADAQHLARRDVTRAYQLLRDEGLLDVAGALLQRGGWSALRSVLTDVGVLTAGGAALLDEGAKGGVEGVVKAAADATWEVQARDPRHVNALIAERGPEGAAALFRDAGREALLPVANKTYEAHKALLAAQEAPKPPEPGKPLTPHEQLEKAYDELSAQGRPKVGYDLDKGGEPVELPADAEEMTADTPLKAALVDWYAKQTGTKVVLKVSRYAEEKLAAEHKRREEEKAAQANSPRAAMERKYDEIYPKEGERPVPEREERRKVLERKWDELNGVSSGDAPSSPPASEKGQESPSLRSVLESKYDQMARDSGPSPTPAPQTPEVAP